MPYKDINVQRAYHRDKYLKDPEKYIDYARQYRKTPKGKKVDTISRWQNALKMKIPNPEEMYERYFDAKQCETCGKEFTGIKKVLDHHHATGSPRFVCCIKCNNNLSKVDRQQLSVLLELHRHFQRQ
tara:strand:+ start:35 stop:415 length:381 start_codon:yes stop_codon:yes gene_type:complete